MQMFYLYKMGFTYLTDCLQNGISLSVFKVGDKVGLPISSEEMSTSQEKNFLNRNLDL